MTKFHKLVYTPAGFCDATLAISACRAGGVGILNAEFETDPDLILGQLDLLSQKAAGEYGLKLDSVNDSLRVGVVKYALKGLHWLILDGKTALACQEWIAGLRQKGVRVLAEMITAHWPEIPLDGIVDGLVIKGNESGGFVGENSSFILLQKWRDQTRLPLFVHGGVTPYVAAACSATGVAGGVLDSQVLLLDESPLAQALCPVLENFSGHETIAVGDSEEGVYFRVLVRPGYRSAQTFCTEGDGQKHGDLKSLIQGKVDWRNPKDGLLPMGQDVCFAGLWLRQYGRMAAVFRAMDSVIDNSLRQAVEGMPLSENAPLAQVFGTRLPVVQGPMSRVSDKAEFARAVSQAGALPVIALALLTGPALNQLLEETRQALGDNPWGIGLLGFAPQGLLDEQFSAIMKYRPAVAIIAGGRPDQVVKLEKAGILAFLHVPTANLIPLFLQEGVHRFIFEGRECGGHIGPLSSFVLWSTMVDRLLSELDNGKAAGPDIQVLFAGGIHDAVSSAMVQIIAAPLVNRAVKIGILMGSSYLFTKEIVESGAIVPSFQQEAIDCEHTIGLQTGPGHASRCAYTPFAQTFLRKRLELRANGLPADESREILDDLIMGRLRLASKGVGRRGDNGEMQEFDSSYLQHEGMYMLGQVAILRKELTDIRTLHGQVIDGANAFLTERLSQVTPSEIASGQKPVDVAIIGMAALLPKANTTQDYWENILNKVDAITEIPSHRWDWRLYYDENRQAKDRIYARRGGFMDDLAFDPTRYGIPPKSIESIDPMQLMALEVARRTLVDAGYDSREFDRERTSVIIGASGGVGDVGIQYGLRAELPRFQGYLPDSVARRLPEWTEDTFPGILPNVVAGRIANRLNLGGVNFTTDAACASSLAAIYQGVTELIAGRSSFVIAGGVDTVQGPFGYMCFSKTQALSPQDRCRTFDASSDGIVISEGIAMVALKRLRDAEQDGDRIYAVIKGVGGSSDGKAKALTAPLPAGQLRAMRRAYDQAGFGPDTVGLFEAHGTGTVAGDTAELESTTTLLKEAGAGHHQAAVGSVKTLIGHTKATAGVAGLIKVTLALHHRVLPPHFGVTTPNPVLMQEDCPLYLTDKPIPWLTVNGHPRRAACSAFGFGGTNFHFALEEYTGEYRPWMRSAVIQRWPAELLLWADNDRNGLVAQLVHIQQGLEKSSSIELRDLACTLVRNWRPARETIAIVATGLDDLTHKIGAALKYLKGEDSALIPGVYHGDHAGPAPKVAVLFSGQGSQYTHMLQELALNFPILAETLSEADERLRADFSERFGKGARLSHFIFPTDIYSEQAKDDATKAMTSTDVAQPALGAVEAGLWRLMHTLGLEIHMLAGHSYGEFPALFAGGFYDFDVLISLSAARGRFIVDAAKAAAAELGTMAAVQASREDVEKAISDIKDVIVANHNAPKQSIISGSTSGVKEAVARISQVGITMCRLPVAAAFHSRFIEPAQAALADLIGKTVWKPGNGIPVYSNTTGEPHAKDIQQIRQTMANHLTRPVEFLAQVEAMYRDGARVFLELGPKAVLTGLIGQILEGRPHQAVAIDGHHGGGIADMLNAIGQLVCAGVKLDVIGLFKGRDCIHGDLADLARLHRVKPVPRHAWLLNGSGARRYTEPVRQIGVRIDATDIHSTNRPQNETPPSSPSQNHAQNNSIVTDRLTSRKQQEDELQMGVHRQAPNAGNSAVMAEYFDTMRQFLKMQERIMSTYMGGSMGREADGSLLQRSTRPQEGKPENVVPFHGPTLQPPKWAVQAEAPRPAEALRVSHGPGETAPKISQPEKVATVTSPANEPEKTIDRDKMTAILLSIVEERTGYPRDMVGLDQNLEADLSIDSIKRVEIVGALLNALPQRYKQALGEDIGTLNTQSTLNGMLDLLARLSGEGGTSLPFDQAGMDKMTDESGHPSRHVIRPKPESIDELGLKRLGKGHFIITQDKLGVAESLSLLLRNRDCTVTIVDRGLLKDENALNRWCASAETDSAAIAGLVHMAQLGADRLQTDAALDDWRHQLQVNEKSFFILLHHLYPRLKEDAHILSASALGGFFHREGDTGAGLALQAGFVGLLKSLHEESPGFKLKAVDVDQDQQADSIATALLGEMALCGGRLEVGYPAGVRTIFQTIPESLAPEEERPDEIRDMVVLATGGLRGVTAEVLRELAIPGNTFLLTGRSPLPDPEPEELQPLTTFSALQQHFVSEVRNGRLQMTLADIKCKIQSILSAREMRLNLADFRKRGATVEYYPVDVTHEDGMHQLLDRIYDQYGKIDGVIHGAGVIEDKLLPDKTSDSWSRVVETKVMGLLLLQKYLRPDRLRFFTVFSSVAGRYGNSGQTDYATANELMNRLCCQLSNHWGNLVNVKAFCWGPWGRTKFGAGMVTGDTEAKFAQKGIKLVSAELGRRVFREELTGPDRTHIEIVCGEGPWEQHENSVGQIERGLQPIENHVLPPLLDHATLTTLPKGEHVMTLCLGNSHAYLQEHCIDNVPVLPAAVALEMMAEAAAHLWPGWVVVEARDCRLLKGIEIKNPDQEYRLVIDPPTYGSSDGFEVNAAIQSEQDNGAYRIHYRSVLRLEHQFPGGFKQIPRLHTEKKLSVTKAYNEWLFHGPRFQVMEKIYGLSHSGAKSLVKTTLPTRWMETAEPNQKWVFDPGIVDAAAQMAILWARTFRDETPLPTRFGRVNRYSETMPEALYMDFEKITPEEDHLIRANVYFSDSQDNVVLSVEDMECVSSAELNRIAGRGKTPTLSAKKG
ncbi:MAG: SDR family NAD(P)-dependent oxidoreductase [Syntrophales bacterium]